MSPVLIIIGTFDAPENLLTSSLGHNDFRYIEYESNSKHIEVLGVQPLSRLPACQTGWFYRCVAKSPKEDCLLCFYIG